MPYSGLLGAILLILADIAARYVIMPQEVPVGVMTAFIGAPFFIYIARKRGLQMKKYIPFRIGKGELSFLMYKRACLVLLSLLVVLVGLFFASAGMGT